MQAVTGFAFVGAERPEAVELMSGDVGVIFVPCLAPRSALGVVRRVEASALGEFAG